MVGCSNARFYRGIVRAHRDSWRIEGRFSALEKPATTHVHPALFKSKITGVIVACSYTMDHVIGQRVEGRPGQSTSIDSLVVLLTTVPTILQKLPLNRETHGLILLPVYKPDRENIFLSRGRWRDAPFEGCNFFSP